MNLIGSALPVVIPVVPVVPVMAAPSAVFRAAGPLLLAACSTRGPTIGTMFGVFAAIGGAAFLRARAGRSREVLAAAKAADSAGLGRMKTATGHDDMARQLADDSQNNIDHLLRNIAEPSHGPSSIIVSFENGVRVYLLVCSPMAGGTWYDPYLTVRIDRSEFLPGQNESFERLIAEGGDFRRFAVEAGVAFGLPIETRSSGDELKERRLERVLATPSFSNDTFIDLVMETSGKSSLSVRLPRGQASLYKELLWAFLAAHRAVFDPK